MHELSLSNAIAAVVLEHAGDRQVRAVQLKVGALRQVVPDSLTFCWSMVSRQPRLEGSQLEIEQVPGVIECGQCGARSTLTENVLLCPACDAAMVTVVSGQEFLVTSIDVDDAPGASIQGQDDDRAGTGRTEG